MAVRPQIWGRDAFFASLFALKGKFMRFAYDTNKTLIPKFHEINGFIGKFGILHADYQVKLIDGQSAQIGVWSRVSSGAIFFCVARIGASILLMSQLAWESA